MGQSICGKGSCGSLKGESEIDVQNPQATEPMPGFSGPCGKGSEMKVPLASGKKLNPADNDYWECMGIDLERPTEDSYAVSHFTGPNSDIRPLLDYTYHKKYTDERMMLQDRIIHDLSAGSDDQHELLLPWVIFTAGAMGAGKGYVMEWMEKQGCLPLSQFVVIDPDQIRSLLPEWNSFVNKDPLSAAKKTQKEAGHIAEILGYKALRERWNVIFDGSLRDVEWYKLYFQKLRHTFPGIRLMILHIQAEKDAVLKRAEERGKRTGRMVPRDLLESSMEAVPKSVAALAPFVDVAVRVLNLENQEPRLEREPSSVNPPEGVPLNSSYIRRLWMPIDIDGDGSLSREEVKHAVSQGILTAAVLKTVDINGDGAISREELQLAVKKCYEGGTVKYAGS